MDVEEGKEHHDNPSASSSDADADVSDLGCSGGDETPGGTPRHGQGRLQSDDAPGRPQPRLSLQPRRRNAPRAAGGAPPRAKKRSIRRSAPLPAAPRAALPGRAGAAARTAVAAADLEQLESRAEISSDLDARRLEACRDM
jgi:hypothetical protein